jgi:hypothetical protein|tara:strand:- start:1270 stop:2283 length:1014 start_codon:yes stop_codon:yes gene_type:complete
MAEIFTRFSPADDMVSNLRQTVSSGMWSGGVGTLTTMYTSSIQSSSNGQYYYDVYKTNPASDSEAEIQLSVAYGHVNGRGSLGQTGNYPSKAIYRQYRNLLLTPGDSKFTFGGSVDADDVYVISVARARLREKMDPGNWELHLTGSSNKKVKLIDDSGATTNPSVNAGGRVFNVVSGSIATGTAVTKTAASAQPGGGYGLFYPDLGIIVLNAPVTATSASFSRTAGAAGTDSNNAGAFFNSVSNGVYFVSRREEQLNTTHYFARVTNKKFNFSNNPTFFTASDGALVQPSFKSDPKTYITTVGLYNDSNELLAVAKLSKPILKSFSREAIIKVKLDY